MTGNTVSVKLDRAAAQVLWCHPAPSVKGEGFVPVQEVRLVARCRDGAGRTWSSCNNYLVSAEERFDTTRTAAMGDSYYGVNGEGPFISMTCEQGPLHDFALPEDGLLRYQLSLFDGSTEVWSQEIERGTTVEGAPRTGVQVLFLHQDSPGASHGAALMRSLGLEVQSRPISFEQFDLDGLLQEARSLVSNQKPTFLVSSGRASEAALEIAIRCSGLKGVLVFSGSGLRFSPWQIDGTTTEGVVCEHSSLRPSAGGLMQTRKVYAEAVAGKANRERGRIEVEKIEAPLYLFSGLDDQVWPSSAFSELAAQRRKQKSCPYPTEHRTYQNVGYDLGPEFGLPMLPTTERTMAHPGTGFRLHLGGKMGRQSRARRECWNRMLEIFTVVS